MKRLASLLAALLTLWAGPALAAIANPIGIGSFQGTTTIASLSTTADVPAGSTIFIAFTHSTSTFSTISDTAGNSYAAHIDFGAWTGAQHLQFIYANNTGADLPAPCTVTASESSTQLIVTGVGTCASNVTFSSGQAISGGSFTGVMNGSCTLVSGAATCAITGGATVASATATVSSVIKITFGSSVVTAIAAAYSTGIATSTPLDVTGTMTTGVSTTNTTISPTVSTGTLAQASELVLGIVVINSTSSAYSSQAPFTDMTGSTQANTSVQWGYDKTAATTTVTYGPKWTTARNYGANVITFKGAAAAPACVPSLALLGVGAC